MKQIFWIILIVVAVIFGAAWTISRSKTHGTNSGEVFERKQAGDQATTDAAATTDLTADQTAPAGQTQQPATPPDAGAQDGVAAAPASDSIARNPPNGQVFAGAGKYQLYRQGDITWRLNTETGKACVLFATDAEWSKPKVFKQGCGGG